MPSHSLIVSLHDVTPCTFERVKQQVEELAELGVHQSSLLAIPEYHNKEQLEKDPSLIQWLQKLQESGHEIVLHGWQHIISETLGNNKKASSWFYENLYTAREAEFLNLGYNESHQLIGKGLSLFKKLNFNTQGFIAPAWLMNPEVEKSAKEHGLLYTNTVSELIHLKNGTRHPTRSCVWSTRSAWRRPTSLLWNRFLFNRLQGVDPIRISLHPADIEYPDIWNQIKKLIQLALVKRKPTTYASWIAKQL